MELVDFLHVPEDDELFVDDAWGNLLHPTGHFPQVGLPKKEAKGFKKKKSTQTLKKQPLRQPINRDQKLRSVCKSGPSEQT